MDFRPWCNAVLRQIRFRPDREAVRQELSGHLEDHCADLEAIGYDHQLAVERALAAMGDAQAVGQAMNRVHSPVLGWMWVISKWLLRICGILLLFLLVTGGGNVILRDLRPMDVKTDYEENQPLFLSPDTAAEEVKSYQRIALGSSSGAVERCGTTIAVPYAALWRSQSEGTDVYWLSMILTARDKRFWDADLDLSAMTLDISGDLHYVSTWAEDARNHTRYSLNCLEQTPFCVSYRIWACLQEDPTEWVELTYPYGEPWSIRVEWEAVTG